MARSPCVSFKLLRLQYLCMNYCILLLLVKRGADFVSDFSLRPLLGLLHLFKFPPAPPVMERSTVMIRDSSNAGRRFIPLLLPGQSRRSIQKNLACHEPY
jgi:hypothetical protein